MLHSNATGIARMLGCVWLGVAGLTALLILMAIGTWLMVWPLGVMALGLLDLLRPSRSALLIGTAGGVIAAAFGLWAASVSTAGNENIALVIAALSGLLAIASVSTRSLIARETASPSASR